MAEAAGLSSAAAAVALVMLVVVPALALLVRRRWRRAAARREEVRRLARLAAEESELAERESVLAYYSELFPGVVHAAEVPEAPLWAPPAKVPAREEELAEAPQPPAGAKGICAVCFRPTTFRCKQCKAVKYCPGIRSEFMRHGTSVHDIKNEENESHRENQNNDVEATTTREKKFGEADRKFLKHNFKIV